MEIGWKVDLGGSLIDRTIRVGVGYEHTTR